MESERRGASGMDAARGVKGQGWPLYAGPRSVDGMKEVERSETRMQGQAFLLTFSAPGKSESPSRAKPASRTTRQRAAARTATPHIPHPAIHQSRSYQLNPHPKSPQ